MTDRAIKLRQLLKEPEILVLPGVYDALTGKIAETVGFKAVVMGGYSIAASRLAQPDVGYLSMTEMTEAVKVIQDAVTLPVVADGDTGYGNALSVRRTVREYEKVGAAAIIFEDQVWPKRCGHMRGKEVIAPEEHEQKIRAAVEAKVNAETLIVARTDARSVLGLDAAIERGKRYLAAGAEALFIEAPQDERELEIISKAFPDTILIANMIEGGRTPCLTARQLEELGFKIVFWPCTALYSVVHCLTSVFKELRDTGTTQGYGGRMLTFSEFNRFIGLEQFQELEQKYKYDGGKNK
ncbi:2,3-dimethylmalate lyase [Sporomusa carbonis]|uniref:isocitrate lyase/PEP mutase family protein n=1 Tax=Sporomusa carbonis TaxID=3076075 RepID=UPI003A5DD61D